MFPTPKMSIPPKKILVQHISFRLQAPTENICTSIHSTTTSTHTFIVCFFKALFSAVFDEGPADRLVILDTEKPKVARSGYKRLQILLAYKIRWPPQRVQSMAGNRPGINMRKSPLLGGRSRGLLSVHCIQNFAILGYVQAINVYFRCL